MAQCIRPVGIDLGTTNSVLAFVDTGGRPETIRNAEGGLTTPSAIYFDASLPIVGNEALVAGNDEPRRLAMFAKRRLGDPLYSECIGARKLPPEVLLAMVLRRLKEDAEPRLGVIKKAVIAVPAVFNEPRRNAMQDVGRLAGIEVLGIINEPTAAALSFGFQKSFLNADGENQKDERLLVYDLGGGKLDVTVMEIRGSEYATIATTGDASLGGLDWDHRIARYLGDIWKTEHGEDLLDDPKVGPLLLGKANQVKHSLSRRVAVPIRFAHRGKSIRTAIDRATFTQLTQDLLDRATATVNLVLDEAGMTHRDLSRLILVGGSTRMPMLREELSRQTRLEPDRSVSPDEAVAHGAAIFAGIRLGSWDNACADLLFTNVSSQDLGILANDPKSGQPRRQIMIKRNTPLPTSQKIRFRTHSHGQQNVVIQVVEGGDDEGNQATQVGKCLVDGLPADASKGTFVDVQFDYSQDGRLTVSAELPKFKHHVQMRLDRASGMSDNLIDAWLRELKIGIRIDTLEDSIPPESASRRRSLTGSGQASDATPDRIESSLPEILDPIRPGEIAQIAISDIFRRAEEANRQNRNWNLRDFSGDVSRSTPKDESEIVETREVSTANATSGGVVVAPSAGLDPIQNAAPDQSGPRDSSEAKMPNANLLSADEIQKPGRRIKKLQRFTRPTGNSSNADKRSIQSDLEGIGEWLERGQPLTSRPKGQK